MKRRLYRVLSLIVAMALLFAVSGVAEPLDADEVVSENVDAVVPEELDGTELSAPGIGEEEATSVETELMAPEEADAQVGADVAVEWGEDIPKAVSTANAVPAKLKLGVKETYKLDVSGLAGGKKVSYTSSDKGIASVSSKGVIKAVKAGTATIKVISGKKTLAKCKVSVAAAPREVAMSKSKATLTVGKTLTLKAKLPARTASNKLVWKSSNAKVATVDSQGKVKAVASGKAKITVTTFNKKKAVCDVTVQGKYDNLKALDWSAFSGKSADMANKNSGKIGLAAAGSRYATARLIVKVKGSLPDLSQFEVEGVLRDKEQHYLIQLSNDTEAEMCANYLSSYPEVVYAEPDEMLGCGSVNLADSSITDISWGPAATYSSGYATSLSKRGKNRRVVVGVIDSGVEYNHPLLSGRLYKGYDVVDDDTVAQDDNGHGTHVAGIIVQCTPDLDVLIMPLRAFGKDGKTSSVIIGNAVQYAINEGVDIINMSLEGGTSSYMDEKVNAAVKKGITVVVAAGNANSDTRSVSPAHNESCITVAALDKDGNRAYFSNYGSAVDIAAPGVGIVSAYPGNRYMSLNGTSMATPHVAAAAALLLCENPGLPPASVEKKLRAAATDRGASGWDSYYGTGFLCMKPFIDENAPVKIPDSTRKALLGKWKMNEARKKKGDAIRFSFTIYAIDEYGNVTLDWGSSGRITGIWDQKKQTLRVFNNQTYLLSDGVLGGGNEAYSGLAIREDDDRQDAGDSIHGKWDMREQGKNGKVQFSVDVYSVDKDGKARIRWGKNVISGTWNSKTGTLTVYKNLVYVLRNGMLAGGNADYAGVATRKEQSIPDETRDALKGEWVMYEARRSKGDRISFGFKILDIDDYGIVQAEWGSSGRILGFWDQEKQTLRLFNDHVYLLKDGVLGGGNGSYSGTAMRRDDRRFGDTVSILGSWSMSEYRKNKANDSIRFDVKIYSVDEDGNVDLRWGSNRISGKWNRANGTLTVYKDHVYVLRNGAMGGGNVTFSGIALKE